MNDLATSYAQGEIVDNDAIEIGRCYEKARTSIVESVKYQIECGRRLAEKKASLSHGEWLPWLEENAGVLGFSTRQTATRLMKLVGYENGTPAHHLEFDEQEAAQISRKTWGHAPTQQGEKQPRKQKKSSTRRREVLKVLEPMEALGGYVGAASAIVKAMTPKERERMGACLEQAHRLVNQLHEEFYHEHS